MKFKKVHLYLLMFSIILGLGLYLKNYAFRKRLEKIGLKAEIYEQYESNGGNGFYNCYFKSYDNKIIAITHNVNSKTSSKGGKYSGKSVLYLKEKEEKFVVIPYKEKEYIGEYLILYPFLIYIISLLPLNIMLGINDLAKKIKQHFRPC